LSEKIIKTKEQWIKLLTPEQYAICREKGTEQAFTGKYNAADTPGTYVCVCCGEVLFGSDAKFDSHCGWPSFFKTAPGNAVEEFEDHTLGMSRTEVTCRRCDSHLGHVFNDGPPPTGLRYCINSVSIRLVEKD
jgi:peptide-methionine (R)-S-oxide reductase